ncbi:DNA mismatch repair protein MutS [Candidatus Dependentiae bacterium]
MGKKEIQKLTPLMQQYFKIREEYRGAILLFQVGDFYEMFFDDAKKASAFLGIALTKRGTLNGEPIPLCGVPLHALDHHLTKLVKGGFKVAICDQLEEATPGKVVERGVTRVLTPGTLTDSNLLDDKSASYLFSFFPTEDRWGLLFGELLTAQLFATILPTSYNKSLETELVRFFPDEILLPHTKLGKSFQSVFKKLGYFTSLEHLDIANKDYTKSIDSWILGQFSKNIVENLNENNALLYALYNFYAYVSKNQAGALEHFRALHFYEPDDFLVLDPSTRKNLELVKNNQDGSRRNTLFALMDKASTSMGSRMVKKWLSRPLVKKEAITQRLDVVERLVQDISFNQKIREFLVQIGDIERIIGRIALRRGLLNDYIVLTRALEIIPELKEILVVCEDTVLLKVICSYIGDFSKIHGLLSSSINSDSSKDWIIKAGFDNKLDELRELVFNSNNKIVELEQKEQKETGINSLKIRYNKVHGYFVEVTKANMHLVPERYKRQQTLANRERYTCRELRDLQDEIVRAKSQIERVEKEVFETIKNEVYSTVVDLRKLAHALAHLDALLSLANCAYDYGYTRPVFNQKREIIINQGCHPVVQMNEYINFIPNDTVLNDKQSLWIVTGPNMGGKSTFLRQVALICIMAQCGSFVPAKAVSLSILDRVFTRIGSGDNLAGGKSTFLVEMEETALICKQATDKSLVILDEVGRGTSTYDGFAIAKAVVEYIHTKIGAKCLFATHYHELNALKDIYPAIESYYASSKKHKDGILFLYKIVKGVADGSFGLEVAKLADLPKSLIMRAKNVLKGLEEHKVLSSSFDSRKKLIVSSDPCKDSESCGARQDYRGAMADLERQKEVALSQNVDLEEQIEDLQKRLQALRDIEKIAKKLGNIDYNELSPKKAFDLLWEFKENS